MTDTQVCEGKFTILGMQNKCLICGKPLKVHLPQFSGREERVIRTPMIPEDEYMALGSDILEDGITRVLVPLNAEDAEVAFINEELLESDRTLASIAKVTEFFEGSESPAEALAGAELEMSDSEVALAWEAFLKSWDGQGNLPTYADWLKQEAAQRRKAAEEGADYAESNADQS